MLGGLLPWRPLHMWKMPIDDLEICRKRIAEVSELYKQMMHIYTLVLPNGR